ncbi:kinase-like protein [Moniliophthora roreri]|nr:kinase-like protein [Moniliophthora roreri]
MDLEASTPNFGGASPDAFSILSSLDAARVPGVVELLQSEAQPQQSSTNNEDYQKLAIRCLHVLVKKHCMPPKSLLLDNIIRNGTRPLQGGSFVVNEAHTCNVTLSIFFIV